MCGIFDFSDFAQKIWKKIPFKFEIWKILVQKYPVGEAFFSKKKYKGFPFKKKFTREFYIKGTQFKIKGNSFVKERKKERKKEGRNDIIWSFEFTLKLLFS